MQEIWGTVVGIDVRDDVDPRVLDACFDFFSRVDDLFSTWRDDTEIAQFRAEMQAAVAQG